MHLDQLKLENQNLFIYFFPVLSVTRIYTFDLLIPELSRGMHLYFLLDITGI